MPKGVYVHRRRAIGERFWPKVRKTDGCWLWTGALDGGGRGMIARGGHSGGYEKAHRYSWRVHFGAIPRGAYVLHRCDVPACVNPDHLFLGTHADNMADMKAKGRSGNQSMRVVACPKGHPYSGSNLLFSRRGWRVCRACRRESNRRYKEELRG